MTHRTTRPRRTAALAALVLVLTAGALAPAQAAGPRRQEETPAATEYTNPVTAGFSDTYADPAVIRGKDGWWYLYATSDPLVEGGEFGLMHVSRSRDLVDWEYVDTIFDEDTRPGWATATSFFWAPDIRYVDGQYVLYYTVTDTVLNAGDDSAIGAATAPTPTGPWTPTEEPVVPPRPDGGGFLWTFDPSMLATDDGTRYLYYGSYYGGLWVSELDETGLRAVGEATQVAVNDKFEGAYVLERDGWYYLMASSANCCAGPSTGYSVFAGRSQSPLGPFVDHEGVSLLDTRPGGTQVLVQNGNRWIGAGHHAVVTDLSGQDWILYHAIDREDPWLAEPGGVNRRPTLMDRLDWVDGWPVTRGGAGPSEGPQPGPVSGSLLGLTVTDPAEGNVLRGSYRADTDPQSGGHALLRGRVWTPEAAPQEVHVELDLRTRQPDPFVLRLGRGSNQVEVSVDPGRRELHVEYGHGRLQEEVTAAIPPGYDLSVWTALQVHLVEGEVRARLSESRLGDVVAEVALDLRPGVLRSAPLEMVGRGAHVDNLSVNAAHEPVTTPVAEPQAGDVLLEEEFTDADLAGWEWVRQDAGARVEGGALVWPVGAGDLVGPGGTGGVLLHEPPEGDWIVETRMTLDLGDTEVRNYQQGGLIVHADDDTFLRLGHVAIWNTRQVEFGKEVRQDGFLSWGGHTSGPPADTTWLRIHHTTNDAGEHLYRSALSTDGETWRWGATWTLPAGTDARVGLYTGGGASPATEAVFDYVRFLSVT
ncbi:glycoside hydrolase [Georgenia sp. 311]|uniref:family 43 glycosylhydrolase n=1 Tax=Georgenia sp. 311 TaxID=2585134 RepID=UPI001111DF79|nr:family 43 glycosylhydrolase [Georgenia sp. 311]TNC20550.1 glycoside hydrolase [Georgenia sp. 311]